MLLRFVCFESCSRNVSRPKRMGLNQRPGGQHRRREHQHERCGRGEGKKSQAATFVLSTLLLGFVKQSCWERPILTPYAPPFITAMYLVPDRYISSLLRTKPPCNIFLMARKLCFYQRTAAFHSWLSPSEGFSKYLREGSKI